MSDSGESQMSEVEVDMTEKIKVNLAPFSDLLKIKYIGKKRARKIIEVRKTCIITPSIFRCMFPVQDDQIDYSAEGVTLHEAGYMEVSSSEEEIGLNIFHLESPSTQSKASLPVTSVPITSVTTVVTTVITAATAGIATPSIDRTPVCSSAMPIQRGPSTISTATSVVSTTPVVKTRMSTLPHRLNTPPRPKSNVSLKQSFLDHDTPTREHLSRQSSNKDDSAKFKGAKPKHSKAGSVQPRRAARNPPTNVQQSGYGGEVSVPLNSWNTYNNTSQGSNGQCPTNYDAGYPPNQFQYPPPPNPASLGYGRPSMPPQHIPPYMGYYPMYPPSMGYGPMNMDQHFVPNYQPHDPQPTPASGQGVKHEVQTPHTGVGNNGRLNEPHGDNYLVRDTPIVQRPDSSGDEGNQPREDNRNAGFGNRRERGKSFMIPATLIFDGTGKWRSFYAKFSSYAEENEWTMREKRNRLCWCFNGKASDYYSHLIDRDPDINFMDLIRKFKNRFDSQDLTDTLILEFQNATQMPRETLSEWGERVVDLASRAYREMPDARMYNMAVVRFCQGLDDKEAGANVSNQRPHSIDSAIDRIRWYQHNKTVMFGRSKKKSVHFDGTSAPEVRRIHSEFTSDDLDSSDDNEGYFVQSVGRSFRNAKSEKPRSAPFRKTNDQSPKESKSTMSRMQTLEEKVTNLSYTVAKLATSVDGLVTQSSSKKVTGTGQYV